MPVKAAGLHLNNEFVPIAGAQHVTDSLKRVLTFQNVLTQKWDTNPELIWALRNIWYGQEYCIPRL
jgi:hypothetical protein